MAPYRSEFQDEVLLQRFDGGANTREDAEDIKDNESSYPVNVDLNAKTIRKAEGFSLFGGTESETVPGFFLYNHRILSRTELLCKTVNDKFKFYDANAGVFHLATDATFTVGRRWWGGSFNGYFYGGNGIDNFVRWRASSYGELSSAVSAGATTIILKTGQGARFNSSGGAGMIEGDTFSWTGVSGDTLTGVTDLSSSHGANAIAIEKMNTSSYSGLPKASVGAIFNNRIFIRDESSPNIIRFSKLADNTNPHDDLVNFTIAGTGTGDAGFDILPAAALAIKQFTNGDNSQSLVAFCADGYAYELVVTDASASTVPTHPVFKYLGGDVAANNMVAATENTLLFVDSAGTLRDVGYSEISTIIRTNRLSDRIQPTVEQTSFTDGVIKYFDRRAFFVGKQNDSAINNFVVVKDTDPDAFVFYTHWLFNSLEEWQNDLYGLSSVNGNVYKLFSGQSAGGSVIDTIYPGPKLNFGAPLNYKEGRRVRIQGLITDGCELLFDFYPDDSAQPATFKITGGVSSVVSAADNVAVGRVIFGRSTFGGNLPPGVSARYFRAEMNLTALPRFMAIQPVVRNSQKDVWFDVQKMRFFARLLSTDVMPDTAHMTPT